MITVEECIGKVVLVRTHQMIGDDTYNEVSFIKFSPSKEYVKVQWHNEDIKWLPIIAFVKAYAIIEILKDIDKEETKIEKTEMLSIRDLKAYLDEILDFQKRFLQNKQDAIHKYRLQEMEERAMGM